MIWRLLAKNSVIICSIMAGSDKKSEVDDAIFYQDFTKSIQMLGLKLQIKKGNFGALQQKTRVST